MAHIDARVAGQYYHADRFYVDFNLDKLDRDKGVLLALDEFGNVTGGVRSTYVDVPVKSYHVADEVADPPDSESQSLYRGTTDRRSGS